MDKKEFKITSTTVVCYKIRTNNNTGLWADITLDEGEKSGRLQIASDYGDWQYYWGACGKNFKEFLIGLDINYAAGKFGANKFFDHEATILELRGRIYEYTGTNDQEARQDLLDELKLLQNSCNKDEFMSVIQDCEKIMEMESDMPSLQMSIEPLFLRFWNELWSVFINEIKTNGTAKTITELEKERSDWSFKVFTDATALSSLYKLQGEVKEIIDDILSGKREPEEYADCLMCLFDSGARQPKPILPEEIFRHFQIKLEKNKLRDWSKNEDNTYSHVKVIPKN